MSLLFDIFITALYTVFIQNLVFSGGYGLSEAIRVSSKPSSFGAFAAIISGFSVVTSTICALIERVESFSDLPDSLYAAIYGIVLFAVYLIVALIAYFVIKVSRQFLNTLGIAALNTWCLPFPSSTTAPPIPLPAA